MAEEMSFAEAEGLEGKERKGRKVKWLIQLLLLLWIRKIFSSHQVSKSISWHLDLFAAVSFFSESCFLKGIEKCGCRSKECIQLSPGLMLTLLPEHPGTSCSCAKGEPHLGKAHCAEQVEWVGNGAAWASSQAEPGKASIRNSDVYKARCGCLIQNKPLDIFSSSIQAYRVLLGFPPFLQASL